MGHNVRGYLKNLSNEKIIENNKWCVVFSGCNHRAIMTDRELHNPIEAQFNAATLHKENAYVCPGCANNERGFCHICVLHSIHIATKLRPLDSRRLF
jgi:hypothetical protein